MPFSRSSLLSAASVACLALLAACSESTETSVEEAAPETEAVVEAAAPETAEIAATPMRYSDEDEALYMQRFEGLAGQGSGGAGLPGYDTMEPVPGTEDWRPMAMAPKSERTISEDAIKAARDYAAGFNSSALLIWRDGKLQYAEYFGDSEPTDNVTSYSLAKPITTVAVGRAIMEGHIESLDQKASDFITEWKGTDKENILVRHFLDMRSGFLRQSLAMEADDILNRAYMHPRHDEVIINDYPMTHEPGTRYEYANATSEMVAPIIERATGMRYGEFVSEEVLKPLGAPGGQVWVNRPGGTAHSGCCILLPAEAWLRMGILFLQNGMWEGERLLPEGYAEEARTATPQNPHAAMGMYVAANYVEGRGAANPEQAMGKTLHSEPYLDKDLFLFDGNRNQVVYMAPHDNMVILRTAAGRAPEGTKWDNSFLPNALISGVIREDGASAPTPQPAM